MLILTNDEIASLLTIEKAIDACEEALKEYALGHTVEVPVTDAVMRGEERFSGREASGHRIEDVPVYYSLLTPNRGVDVQPYSQVRLRRGGGSVGAPRSSRALAPGSGQGI